MHVRSLNLSGKIDLDKLNRKPVVEKVEEKKVETPAPVVKGRTYAAAQTGTEACGTETGTQTGILNRNRNPSRSRLPNRLLW